MSLSLVVGPAHAGKVAHLLDGYLERLADDPWLIVPMRGDVERVEHDLLRRSGALLGGTIGTFDDLFSSIAAGGGGSRRLIGDTERTLVIRRVIAHSTLDRYAPSSRRPGFADALATAFAELESALVVPEQLEGDLAHLFAAYREELARIGVWDIATMRSHAAARLASDLASWRGAPVFAYGFEDLTAAEWSLLEALVARTDVTVSLPYEPGRPAFASLSTTVRDLAAIATDIYELGPAPLDGTPPSLTHLERELFQDAATQIPLDGAVRFLEAAGTRGVLALVGQEICGLHRSGTPLEQIGVVCESLDRWQGSLAAVFSGLGLPYDVDSSTRLPSTTLGHALLALLRYAWQGADRSALFVFLRSPYSGQGRPAVDYLEGRLRGRGVRRAARVEEELERLRPGALPAVAMLRDAEDPVDAVRLLLAEMVRHAHDPGRPIATSGVATDLRIVDAIARVLDELELSQHSASVRRDELLAMLERATVRLSRSGDPGRVAVLDFMRARTRSFEIVFVLGLEEGSVPRRPGSTPIVGDDLRRRLASRLERPDQVSRDRYLYYTACTRARRRLYLVREAATDDGSPREASPFWVETQGVFAADDVARWTRRRPLSALTWQLESAPTERERVRAVALMAASEADEAAALAAANGWDRRLTRARGAFSRRTRLRNPAVLSWLGQRRTFGVTELERFADCSSAWFIDRVVDPKTIDAEIDAKLRGSIAHSALHRFYTTLPREVGTDRVTVATVDAAVEHMRRTVDQAVASGLRIDVEPIAEAELRQTLQRDLEAFVRDEAQSTVTLVPDKFEVGFGSDRSAPNLQRGLELADGVFLSGKIDRVDRDPFGARGIVQDYKSGKSVHSAREIESELRLQIPLYMLVLRDLVGLEPLGGLYRALAGRRLARGMLRENAVADIAGFVKSDYLDDDAFWTQVETARDRAAGFAQRIQRGDVAHDPKGGECPAWCDLWPTCRVTRG